MSTWWLKPTVSYKTLEEYGFQLRSKYYMRKIDNLDFVFIGTEEAYRPRVISLLIDDNVAPYIQDLIEAELVEERESHDDMLDSSLTWEDR